MNEEHKTFCLEQFKINFVSNNISQFIGEIHHLVKQKGELRDSISSKFSSYKDQIKKFVADGQIEEAVELIESVTESTQYEDDGIKLTSRWRKHKRRNISGVLYLEDKVVQENQIIEAILELLELIQNGY